jgi:prefoldin alpha subunit
MEHLMKSMETLAMVAEKFAQGREALDAMKPENKGKPVLVPITSSLYVGGTLDDTDTVLVDIGAKYFVRKPIAAAKEYATRRNQAIQANVTKLEAIMTNKQRLHDGVLVTLQAKAQQQQGPGTAAAPPS